jgi:diacylglycerol kinase family enzyme
MATTERRLAAIGALTLGAATVAWAVYLSADHFPRGLVDVGLLAVALACAWAGAIRKGAGRVLWLAVAAALGTASLILVLTGGSVLATLLVFVGAGASIALAGAAVRIHVPLPAAPPPKNAVLFYNPKSGGGKAERFEVAREARERGIEPIELKLGVDLNDLVADAIAGGADALAMAGGDGSQAIVAAAAAEHGLPYACIPSGTRNHFALDLGVDRDDVVGALDAFVDGGERTVDLAEVNGRVFVNNVSLGLYAEAVQREGYREAKLRTILDTVPEMMGADASPQELAWDEPDRGERRDAGVILVSNNVYLLGTAIGSGTRPAMDRGEIGVAVIGDDAETEGRSNPLRRPWRSWATPQFEVRADGPVPAGVDGEALRLDPPLRFRSRPRALSVRIARAHPGASPSAAIGQGGRGVLSLLVRLAGGQEA